jgi:hypothetical protein
MKILGDRKYQCRYCGQNIGYRAKVCIPCERAAETAGTKKILEDIRKARRKHERSFWGRLHAPDYSKIEKKYGVQLWD